MRSYAISQGALWEHVTLIRHPVKWLIWTWFFHRVPYAGEFKTFAHGHVIYRQHPDCLTVPDDGTVTRLWTAAH